MPKLRYFVIVVLLGVLALSVINLTHNSESGKTSSGEDRGARLISVKSLLTEMIDRDLITHYPDAEFRLKQESSYNRASDDPQNPETWFLNHDFNSNKKDKNFIRIEETANGNEWVLMDAKGPGALVRTWMPWKNDKKATTNSIIRFYIDGAKEPVLEGNMFELLNGKGAIPFPLAHESLRSAVSFYPIPYAKGLKITVSERPFFYQMTYREYNKTAKVESYSAAEFTAAIPLMEKVAKQLNAPYKAVEGQVNAIAGTLNNGEEKSLDIDTGSSAINELSLKLNDYSDKNITRSVVLKIEFDGQQTVYTPISEFFGTGVGLNPFEGWYRTVTKAGKLTTRWVMPFQKTAKVSILNMSNKPVDFTLQVKVTDRKWDDSSLYFHASWRGEYPVATRPFSDWNYVKLSGRGVYVGDTLTIWNPIARWWGEGDEKIYVDGETFPSIFGTGTEDYYGYSWGGISTDFYQHPFHAQPASNVYNQLNRKETNERNTQGYSVETRTRSLDTMPFSKSLTLDMEVWHWKDVEMGYAVGAYWYGDLATKNNGETNVTNAPKLTELESKLD
ncbi:DUF2961 domain-containing protein [Psychrosphaera sp. B3R10]|uniref:glycoside hydrolase family 172 protein n=1 Tax=unclassified Psychrosphaera TaxID=2641570 RepID=UPI001C09D50D|nr:MULTISPECIES: glycoside hydrolase family 172 protein [unclassified Psychrosphaera]MBU2882472.1 DUF2961 domain-containing protein [Psychrosphaera sp. I2R16]MBU2990293.1 DUF2961 domain-containing protein [Psychrosphaera sp. B3R10]